MKILLSLPESPFDPTNGAARSMRTIAELMAAAGHKVRCVATTATERPGFTNGPIYGETVGEWESERTMIGGDSRDVGYRLLNVKGAATLKWRTESRELRVDGLFDYQLFNFKPDLLLCYGGHPTDIARFHRAKRAGCKIVFGLRNYGYQRRGFLDFADGVLTSSRFLTNWYRDRFGIESTSLPLPIWPEDVIAQNREPKYFTAINPTREKGQMILATVFKFLGEERSDIPLQLVTTGSQTWPEPLWTTVIPWQAQPKEIYRQTKVLLVPSVWEEPAGRVIAEAMLNGIPPIITDRGGMVEVANGGAFVLPLAKHITPQTSQPVPLSVAQPWIDLIVKLHDAGDQTSLLWTRTAHAAQIYQPENLTPRYVDYFERILAGKPIEQQHGPCMDLASLTEDRSHTAEGRTNV
jgi:glycosyltransferase involved in cell wall biosynthesis